MDMRDWEQELVEEQDALEADALVKDTTPYSTEATALPSASTARAVSATVRRSPPRRAPVGTSRLGDNMPMNPYDLSVACLTGECGRCAGRTNPEYIGGVATCVCACHGDHEVGRHRGEDASGA